MYLKEGQKGLLVIFRYLQEGTGGTCSSYSGAYKKEPEGLLRHIQVLTRCDRRDYLSYLGAYKNGPEGLSSYLGANKKDQRDNSSYSGTYKKGPERQLIIFRF
jgi:hypothetical protein